MSSFNPTFQPASRADAVTPYAGLQPDRVREDDATHTPHRLSLCNDVVFKALFSRHPHLLSDLINAVRHPAAPIRVTRILNPNILPQDLAGKDIVLDILAEDESGQRIGIEMQLQRFRHWAQRSVYGVARSLAGQLQAGENYYQLKPAIGISLLAHTLFSDYPAKATWHFTLRDAQLVQVQLGDVLQMHIIELRKAEALGKLPKPLLAWIACLLHNLDEAAMNEITHAPVKEALSHLDAMYADEELRLMAQRREQALVDAEDMLDQARYEGEQKGLLQGMEQGLQEGLLQQRQVLHRMLEHKFGPVPKHYQAQLSQASADQLQAWSLNMLDARRIDDVLIWPRIALTAQKAEACRSD